MINEQFFNYVKLLDDKFSKRPQYNLFSVLRSESDEVRLHSRFLADLINPQGSHKYKDRFLNIFLERLNLQVSGEVSVDVEYKNIDILIRSADCAIIIENKIYAGDQPEQLSRYYQTMKDQGYTNIKLVYLTLDGYSPSDDSTDGLAKGTLSENLILASYEEDIYKLIDRSIEIAATDAPLREALIQYRDIIVKLTQKIEDKEHMDALKKLLSLGNNLATVPTLLNAYKETLVDLQLDVWNRIAEGVRNEFGSLHENSVTENNNSYSLVKAYVENRRNSKYLGISTLLKGYKDTYILVEQDHRIYFGIYCEEGNKSKEYKMVQDKIGNRLDCYTWETMPLGGYAQPEINFKHLTSEDLLYLSEELNRQTYADFIVNKLKEAVDLIKL